MFPGQQNIHSIVRPLKQAQRRQSSGEQLTSLQLGANIIQPPDHQLIQRYPQTDYVGVQDCRGQKESFRVDHQVIGPPQTKSQIRLLFNLGLRTRRSNSGFSGAFISTTEQSSLIRLPLPQVAIKDQITLIRSNLSDDIYNYRTRQISLQPSTRLVPMQGNAQLEQNNLTSRQTQQEQSSYSYQTQCKAENQLQKCVPQQEVNEQKEQASAKFPHIHKSTEDSFDERKSQYHLSFLQLDSDDTCTPTINAFNIKKTEDDVDQLSCEESPKFREQDDCKTNEFGNPIKLFTGGRLRERKNRSDGTQSFCNFSKDHPKVENQNFDESPPVDSNRKLSIYHTSSAPNVITFISQSQPSPQRINQSFSPSRSSSVKRKVLQGMVNCSENIPNSRERKRDLRRRSISSFGSSQGQNQVPFTSRKCLQSEADAPPGGQKAMVHILPQNKVDCRVEMLIDEVKRVGGELIQARDQLNSITREREILKVQLLQSLEAGRALKIEKISLLKEVRSQSQRLKISREEDYHEGDTQSAKRQHDNLIIKAQGVEIDRLKQELGQQVQQATATEKETQKAVQQKTQAEKQINEEVKLRTVAEKQLNKAVQLKKITEGQLHEQVQLRIQIEQELQACKDTHEVEEKQFAAQLGELADAARELQEEAADQGQILNQKQKLIEQRDAEIMILNQKLQEYSENLSKAEEECRRQRELSTKSKRKEENCSLAIINKSNRDQIERSPPGDRVREYISCGEVSLSTGSSSSPKLMNSNATGMLDTQEQFFQSGMAGAIVSLTAAVCSIASQMQPKENLQKLEVQCDPSLARVHAYVQCEEESLLNSPEREMRRFEEMYRQAVVEIDSRGEQLRCLQEEFYSIQKSMMLQIEQQKEEIEKLKEQLCQKQSQSEEVALLTDSSNSNRGKSDEEITKQRNIHANEQQSEAIIAGLSDEIRRLKEENLMLSSSLSTTQSKLEFAIYSQTRFLKEGRRQKSTSQTLGEGSASVLPTCFSLYKTMLLVRRENEKLKLERDEGRIKTYSPVSTKKADLTKREVISSSPK